MKISAWCIYALIYLLGIACQPTESSEQTQSSQTHMDSTQTPYPTIGEIERLDPALDAIISPGTKIEILAEGFDWTEGPLWLPSQEMLIFSDIPPNTIYMWREGENHEVFLTPSGYTGTIEREGEPGSNGLTLNSEGQLVLCQHGDRRMARMDAPLNDPQPNFVTLADKYQGKRLNSPNDAVYHKNGDLYFTDPPYGLEGNVDDPAKELDFQGVYKCAPDGTLTLLTDELSRPNGLAFSPDGNTLYIANSDPERAIWMTYDVQPDGTITNGSVFYDATEWVGQKKGLPDGMKIDTKGNIFATGPGGVWIFSPDGIHLGTIHTTQATSNCAFGGQDGTSLFITADMYLCRVQLATQGEMPGA